MNETRNSKSLLASIGEFEAGLRDLLINRPKAWIDEAREKMRDLPKTNYELGCKFAEQGLLSDAIFRFNMVLRWKPDYPNAWYQLGCCYYRKGEYPKAADALKKALSQDPTNRDAVYILAAVAPGAVPAHLRPTRMPKPMVQQFFASQADTYDAAERANQYPFQSVHEALKPFTKIANPVVLDLGCGTGLIVRPWRVAAASVTGVDVIPAMLQQARTAQEGNRPLYDNVIEADLTEPVPQALGEKADLVLCINVASYVGDLVNLFQTAVKHLAPGGLFAISTEPYARDGFGVSAESGRFGHSPAYLRQLAQQLGLSTAHEQRIELYPDFPVQLQVFQAP